MEWLEPAVHITVILSFIGGILGAIFNFVVIKPLQNSINQLSDAVNKLAAMQANHNERINQLQGAIDRIEQAVITAHARIDKFLHEGSDFNAKP